MNYLQANVIPLTKERGGILAWTPRKKMNLIQKELNKTFFEIKEKARMSSEPSECSWWDRNRIEYSD